MRTIYRGSIIMPSRAMLAQMLRDVGLSPRQLLCLAMWHFDGASQRDIAETLGISHQAVCQHTQEGRRKLKEAGFKLRPLATDLECPAQLRGDLGPGDVKARW